MQTFKKPTMTQASPPAPADFGPTETFSGDLSCGILFLCDHASNAVPSAYGDLGLPAEQFQRHIGYDIGARPLTLALAERLNAPALMTTYSRLLIDPNRGEDDPTIVMRLSDGAVVPGNAGITTEERQRRIETYHRPYHRLISDTLDQMLELAPPPVIISMHSYTPVWRGVPRPWHAGILWDTDARAVHPVIDGLAEQEGIVVGDNEPYDGALKNDTMYQHATCRGLAHALIEIRQDLIADEAGVAEWTGRLLPILTKLPQQKDLREIRKGSSRCDTTR